jgi:hypothetical protein
MKADDIFLLLIHKGSVARPSYMIENTVDVPFSPSYILRSSISKRTILSGRTLQRKKQDEKKYT